jgi:hypothetical protein
MYGLRSIPSWPNVVHLREQGVTTEMRMQAIPGSGPGRRSRAYAPTLRPGSIWMNSS